MSREEGNSIEDFELQIRVFATPSSEAWRIYYSEQNRPATFWVSKVPCPAQVKERLRKQLKFLKGIRQSSILNIHRYGFDKEERAFYISDAIDSNGLLKSATEEMSSQREAERRFIMMLRCMASLHKEKMAFGSLHPNSFVLDRSGDLQLSAFINLVSVSDDDTDPLMNLCVAPELYEGDEHIPDTRADVYSLGMICCWLFAGEYPFHYANIPGRIYDGSYQTLAKGLEGAHPWLPSFLQKALHTDPEKRFTTAGEALQYVYDFRNRSFLNAQTPLLTDEGKKPYAEPPALQREKAKVFLLEGSGARNNKILYAAFAVLISVLISLMYYLESNAHRNAVTYVQSDKVLTFADLNQMRSLLLENSFRAFNEELQTLSDSEDPLLYHFLAELALELGGMSQGSNVLQSLEKVIDVVLGKVSGQSSLAVYRVYDHYLHLGRDELRERRRLPVWYKNLILLANPAIPLREQQRLDDQLYTQSSKLFSKLYFARHLDRVSSPDDTSASNISGYIRNTIGYRITDQELRSLSLIARIILSQDVSDFFNDIVRERMGSLDVEDLRVILPHIALRDHPLFADLLTLAKEKQVLSSFSQIYLDIMQRSKIIGIPQKTALLNAAFGSFSAQNLTALARWLHIESEYALLGLVTDERVSEQRVEIFDVLASKNHAIEPAESIVAWIRKNAWEHREHIAPLVGMVTYSETYSKKEIFDFLTSIKKHISKPSFISLCLRSKHGLLILAALDFFGDKINIGDKLILLRHSDKDVRIAAVHSIETNDLTALKIIKDAYKAEKDEDVKRAYKKFWMLR